MADDLQATVPPRLPARRRRWLRIVAWLGAVVVVIAAAGMAFLGTQTALDGVIRRAVTAAEGRLTIEGAEGSLLSTVHIARVVWHGDDVEVEAQAMALTWSVTDLLSRRFNVTGLGAHRIALTFKTTPGAATSLPQSLALPLEVAVRNVGVERLEWRVGDRAGVLTGVAFDYAGGAHMHSLSRMRLVTDDGALTGNVDVGAVAPFTVQGALDFAGDGRFRDTRATVKADGTLEALVVTADGSTHDAALALRATFAPFATVPLSSAHIDAHDVDIARFVPALPMTRLTLAIDAQPTSTGFGGTLAARNAEAGTLDAHRVPLTVLESHFVWDAHQLVLDGIAAELPGNARVTGSAAIPVDGTASRWQLDVRGLDLQRVHSALIATRLNGTLAAEVAQATQSIRGDLAQADMSLAFAATVAGKRVEIERFHGRAGTGEATGHGRIVLEGERSFEVTLQAAHLDPSRFGAFPAGNIDGSATAHGHLQPAWNVAADVTLANGTHLAGFAINGTARGSATPTSLHDVAVKMMVGSTALTLNGSVGNAGDKLAYSVDVAKLSEARPLLTKYAGVAVPEIVAGAMHVRGTLTSEPGGNGLTLHVRGEDLQWGKLVRIATLEASTSLGAGDFNLNPAANAARAISIRIDATHVVAPQGELASFSADASGTLAHHVATFAVAGDGVDAHARLTGGISGAATASRIVAHAWAGTVDTLENRGLYALSLEAPTPIEWSPDQLHVGAARVHVAEGIANLAEFRWDAGKLTTRGAFSGVPVAAILRLAGRTSPLATTLAIGGDWSLAATPHLNGSIHIARERGDIYGTESLTLDPGQLALGITTLELDARFADDAVNATAKLRSLRAGDADGTLTIAAVAGAPPGRFPVDAPLSATLNANLASLKPLQPWLSTAAVLDGTAHVELAGHGTLRALELSGSLRGDDVRLDVPQYGVHLREGRLRASVHDNTLVLDDLAFTGGDGRFTAQGTLVRVPRAAGEDPAPLARVTWKAEKFRVVNRPDLNLVVGGSGTLSIEDEKVALRGDVRIEEGRIDYSPPTVGTLGGDVVIVGQPRSVDHTGAGLDLPLVLDLKVALGPALHFSGQGLDTRLAGELHLTTASNGSLAARGSIQAVNGTYFAFGQRLEIDRGELIFDGPASNPALNIVALRRNAAVEAGVEVTGNVRVPRVRLVSNPPVPDGEKLSWLMTGQGLDRASRADLAALGAASASLLGGGQKPLTTTIANTIGIDDISLREARTTVATATAGQVVAFGKRISDRLTLVYEQGLTVANNALRIEYTLSRSLTLRAETGVVSSLGLYFRRTYD
jgi:translocation and assembly module TamB